MSKRMKGKRAKRKSFGRRVYTLFMGLCILLFAEVAWKCYTGSETFGQPGRHQTTLDGVFPEPVEGFLPVCHRKTTDERMVALTIDDCNQAENLQEMIEIISGYGGKATLFPIGENVSFLEPVLRSAVQKGFEIENHTQNHSGLYDESDEGLAYQIWQQNYEVSCALGVDYQMHFLRPRGGDNRYDQRTHAYMRQMGYYGIAYWSQIGSGSTANEVMNKLTPGDIILFHATDQDLAVIRELVPRLQAAGYKLVTLNEMFGLEGNEQGVWKAEETVPLKAYRRFDQTLQKTDYLHDVLLVQERLSELGFLSGGYNGYFGTQTEAALREFQTRYGLDEDGKCGPQTWRALFGR